MDILARLNPQQRLAVEHGRGPALVLAGAGSGKTRVIAYRIAYLIRNGACRPENILAVTFTNKAADEMKERVHALLGPRRTAEPLISTFHSFCVRILRREIERIGYRSDFSIYDTDDQKRLIKQILKEMGIAETGDPPAKILARISFAKNHGISPEGYAPERSSPERIETAEIYARYDAALRRANALDFDDLLLKAVDVLERFPERRAYYSERYRYILVDEYQDTNRAQYELLRLLADRHDNVFVVGDEDQSIYRFRGAEIRNILNFERDFPGARIIKLEQNYRSTKNILSVAGAVVSHNRERKGKSLWTANDQGEAVMLYRALSARAEALWVADRVQELLDEDGDRRIAILYRTNFLSRNFEEVLRQRGIPFAVVGSVAFFGRMEVKDMLAYLRIIYNPEDDAALLRIINTPPRGIGAGALDMLAARARQAGIPLSRALREAAQETPQAGRGRRALAEFQRLLDEWTALRDRSSPAELLKTILETTRYREMLEKQETREEAASRMANIEELMRAAQESQERGETVFEFLDRASLSSELDNLDTDARVALMTVHSAKGLEFDVVFLAGMEEGLLPHALSMGSPEELEEERRLCYVAITRARRKLFLTWTPYRRGFMGGPAEPSRFLDEMPPELVRDAEFPTQTAAGTLEEQEGKWRRPRGRRRARRGAHSLPDDDLDSQDAAAPRTMQELRAYMALRKAEPQAPPQPVLKPGTRVRHPSFGEGIVLKRERSGRETKLTISFSRVGRKMLIERYARLEAL